MIIRRVSLSYCKIMIIFKNLSRKFIVNIEQKIRTVYDDQHKEKYKINNEVISKSRMKYLNKCKKENDNISFYDSQKIEFSNMSQVISTILYLHFSHLGSNLLIHSTRQHHII